MTFLRSSVVLSLFLVGCAGAAPAVSVTTPTAATIEKAAAPPPAEPAPIAEPSKGALAPPLDKVLEEAKAAKTPALLYFGAVWCQPCAMVEKTVLPNLNVTAVLESYRFQKYDAEIGEGAVLARSFGLNAYPTLVFLDLNGKEVARMIAPQTPEGFAAALKTTLPLATATDEALDTSDPKAVLRAAQAEELKNEPGARERARKLYVLASKTAKKQKDRTLQGQADLAILQIDTRQKERRQHVVALLEFARTHAASPNAIDALEGLLAFGPDVKPGELKRPAKALIAAQKGLGLRRVGAALKKLGDDADAIRAEHAADKESAPTLVTDAKRDAIKPADPLVARPSFAPPKVSPEQLARMQFPQMASRQLVEDCRHLPRATETTYVRVYPEHGAISRAVVLDPELSPALRLCLERSATNLKNVPTDESEKLDLRVTFAPAH